MLLGARAPSALFCVAGRPIWPALAQMVVGFGLYGFGSVGAIPLTDPLEW